MAIYTYWAGSGVFSGYNFIAELTSSHKIWQQVLHCQSETKSQPSLMSKKGPEAEWIELYQYLSPPVLGPLSAEGRDGKGDRTLLILSWHLLPTLEGSGSHLHVIGTTAFSPEAHFLKLGYKSESHLLLTPSTMPSVTHLYSCRSSMGEDSALPHCIPQLR